MNEMTASDMLRDPMIRQVLRADRISLASFAALLDTASRRQTHRAAESTSPRPANPEPSNDQAFSSL